MCVRGGGGHLRALARKYKVDRKLIFFWVIMVRIYDITVLRLRLPTSIVARGQVMSFLCKFFTINLQANIVQLIG